MLRDLLAHQRVRAAAQLARALRQLGDSDLSSRREGQAERPALVKEGRHRDRPALARLTKDLRLRHLHVLEEDLVELSVTGDLDQRAHLDARTLHVHEQVGEAVTRVRLFPFAGEEHAPLRDVGQRRPHLLPVDDVVIAGVLGARLQAGKVAARVRLAEALAPDLLG